MSDRRDVIYLFDGTFDGLLCCVYESYIRREVPTDLLQRDTAQLALCEMREIVTTQAGAQRVFASLGKLGTQACDLIDNAFLNGDPGKDYTIFCFIRLGYRVGPRAADMLGDDVVSRIHKLAQAATHEAHLLTGFVRFSDYSGALVAVIEPKHFVLPLMVSHFCGRFNGERFLIYDKARGMALVYRPYEWRILAVEDFSLPCADEDELEYRRLWTRYFNTIAIEARRNPRCQMSHMPKRFWKHMTEIQTIAEQGGTARKPLLPKAGSPGGLVLGAALAPQPGVGATLPKPQGGA